MTAAPSPAITTTEIGSVLFVDDEPMVLSGLRRSMRAFRDEWSCDFANGGEEALAMMAARSYDVVVTDMMMPGMTGADLLSEVVKRYPATVRIVLSGQADSALVSRSMNYTHRFLEKPCELETLRETLNHATSIGFALRDPGLAALAGRITQLPSPPEICRQLDKKLQSDDVNVEQVGELISRDVSITAQILKVVNSPFFGLAQPVETPQEAVAYLGVETVRSLALFSNLTERMIELGVNPTWVDSLWQHSMRVSAAAKTVARVAKAPVAMVKESTTAGLLHDVGKLILALNFPGETERVSTACKEEKLALETGERRQWGCSHAEVGGYLFALWGLPLPVVKAVAWHHRPGADDQEGFSPTVAVHVADAVVHDKFNEIEGGAVLGCDMNRLTKLGLAEQLPRWRTEIEAVWEQ